MSVDKGGQWGSSWRNASPEQSLVANDPGKPSRRLAQKAASLTSIPSFVSVGRGPRLACGNVHELLPVDGDGLRLAGCAHRVSELLFPGSALPCARRAGNDHPDPHSPGWQFPPATTHSIQRPGKLVQTLS